MARGFGGAGHGARRAAALVAGLALAAGACGRAPVHQAARQPAGVAIDSVLASVAQKSEATTAKLAFTMSADLKGLPMSPPTPMQFGGTGAFDYVAKRGSFTMDFPNVGSVSETSTPAPMTKLEMVVDGDNAYMRLPAPVVRNGQAKTWAKLPASGLPASPGTGSNAPLPMVPFGGMGDPSIGFHDLLKGIGVTGTVVGHEVVRGVDTTHFRTTIDGSTAGAPGGSLFGGMGQPGTGKLPADVWVDAAGRLVKVSMVYEFSQSFQGLYSTPDPSPAAPQQLFSFRTTVTFESYDYGVPVSVVVPSPADVVDAADVPDLGLGG
jgi:hypothetical protein